MNNFSFYNPTKIFFGKGQLAQLSKELPKYGSNVLLVYGGGSIKKNGLYEQVIAQLEAMQATVHELANVEPNPRMSTVRKGVEICKVMGIEVILAVGGGSVIDCSKLIAAGAKYAGDPWDFVIRKAIPATALPLATVLTIAATGSEMNAGSVITNMETGEKYGWGSPHVFPKFSILDPTHTFTVPRDQTVYGIVDMMSHVFEQYFHQTSNTPLQDRFCESLLRTVIETAPKLVQDLDNYENRETIMYCGTIALNNSLAMGAKGDWASHEIEHAISAVYDIPHAGGLAIVFPQWMRYVLQNNPQKLAQLAVRVFDVEPDKKTEHEIAEEGIRRLEQFWKGIGAPNRLKDYNIDDSRLNEIAEKAMRRGPLGTYQILNYEDVLAILKQAL